MENNEEIKGNEDDLFKGVDKKLGDLMLRGWTMLADSCPLPSCRCPLMRSPDGQKYCVNCEMWQFDNKKREKKKFTDLVPLQGKQSLQVKHTEVIKPVNKSAKSWNVQETLKEKIEEIAGKIKEEQNYDKIQKGLQTINMLLDTIEKIEKYNKNK